MRSFPVLVQSSPGLWLVPGLDLQTLDWMTESWKVEAVPLESPFASSAAAVESEGPGSVKFLQVVLGDVSDSGSGLPPCCIMSDEVAM